MMISFPLDDGWQILFIFGPFKPISHLAPSPPANHDITLRGAAADGQTDIRRIRGISQLAAFSGYQTKSSE